MQNNKLSEESLNIYGFSTLQQIILLLYNYIPFVHVIIIISIIVFPWTQLALRLSTGIIILYLLPPLLARAVLIFFPITETQIPIPSRAYFTWWFLLNLQIIFCRLTFLDEILRIIPGAYSLWLRLWGSHIGKFTYWAPGLKILDRGFLEIGNNVAFGAGVHLDPHVIIKNKAGVFELILARVRIEDGALIGAYSLLAAGTVISKNEITKAKLLSPPFTLWKNGKRNKLKDEYKEHSTERQPDDN